MLAASSIITPRASPLGIPGQPAPAAVVEYNTLAFSDPLNSLGTVDVNNVKPPGAKWFVDGAWVAGRGFGPPAPSSDFSLVNGQVTTLNSPSGAAFGCTSACWDGASGHNGYVLDWSKGLYIEIQMAFDPNAANGGQTFWPAFWSWDVSYLLSGNFPVDEVDFYEGISTGAGVSANYSINFWPSNGVHSTNTNNNPGNSFRPTDSLFHKYALRQTIMAKNGGIGLLERWYDDTAITSATVSYSAAAPLSPGMSGAGGNPTGCFSEIESHVSQIILGPGRLSDGSNWAVSWKNCGVWVP